MIKKCLLLLSFSLVFLPSCVTVPRGRKELKQECMCDEGYDKSHRIKNTAELKKIGLPDKAYVYFKRAMLYDKTYPPEQVRNGNPDPEKWFDQAVADYTKVIALAPNSADAYYNRGILLFIDCKQKEALNDFNRAIELDPNFYQALNNRGLMLIWSPKKVPTYEKDRVKDFTRALKINPKYWLAYYNRAVHYTTSRLVYEVISDLKKAVEFIPPDEDPVLRFRIHQHLANHYIKKRLCKEAIDELSACLNIVPFENCLLGHLVLPLWTTQERAKCYMMVGDYDKAWNDVHTFEAHNTLKNSPPIDQVFLEELKQKSGREK